MESGGNDLYTWELINNAWKVTPKRTELPTWKKPQTLAKLGIDIKATTTGRVTEEKKHYEQ